MEPPGESDWIQRSCSVKRAVTGAQIALLYCSATLDQKRLELRALLPLTDQGWGEKSQITHWDE